MTIPSARLDRPVSKSRARNSSSTAREVRFDSSAIGGRKRLNSRRAFLLGALCLVVLQVGGCVRVQPWEREVLSLTPMAVESGPGVGPEQNFQTIREGASGGNGASAGGGCGCS